MKKLLLAAFVLASAAFSAKAQQGSVLVYGNLSLGSTKKPVTSGDGSSVKTTAFSIAPGVGYQFNKNWTAGAELGLSTSKVSGLDAVTTFKAGPFVRYTYPISEIFCIYGQGGVGFEGAKKTSGVYAYVMPAVGINIKNGFALNFAFGGINFENLKPKGGSASSSFGLNFGQGASFGISKNFGGKK